MNESLIKDFVLESELISKEDIERANDLVFEKNIDFLEALLEIGSLDQESLVKISAAIMGIPRTKLSDKVIPIEIFSLIPEPISSKYKVISFEEKEKEISVAFCEMKSLEILEELFPEKKVKLFWSSKEEIEEKNEKYHKINSERLLFKSANAERKILKMKDFGISEEKDLPENYFSDIANDLYAEKFLNSLLSYAINSKAESIFFNFSEEDVKISFRIFDRNYNILNINRDTLFSISAKLKLWSDVNIFEKYIIKQGNFIKESGGGKHLFFTTFTKSDFGESISIQINKDKQFKTSLSLYVRSQINLLKKSQKKDSGIFLFSGDKIESKKVIYSFIEYDLKKNKNIYSLEKEILMPLSFVKQITLSKKIKVLPIFLKILEDRPDTVALEKISKTTTEIIFNYVSGSKKALIFSEEKIFNFVKTILESDFDKGQVVKNFNTFLFVKNFKKLNSENSEKYFLKKDEEKIILNFLSQKEISRLFKEADFLENSKKSVRKISFHTKKNSPRNLFKKNKRNKIVFENKEILGLLDLGLFIEKEFIKKHPLEKIKNNLTKEKKKVILENSLLASYSGKIDIKEVIKFLTSQ